MEKMLKKSTLDQEQDRLSALPDAVLLHILSLLNDMKQVQKTSVLSKRWENLWTFMPTLTFQQHKNDASYDDYHEETRKFITWVHKTLLGCRNASIQKINVTFNFNDCFASDIDSWCRFVFEKQVKELSLTLFPRTVYSLPQFVCCNSFLMSLSIRGCNLIPKRGLNWARLKSLTMSLVELNEDTIAKMFLFTPMLEYLKLEDCSGFETLDINSESLRELVIGYNRSYLNGGALRVSAPNLQSLNIFGEHKKVQFPLKIVSSMLKAELNFSVNSKYGFSFDEIELLETLQHVSELELGYWCIQALAPILVEGKTLSSPLTALTCLKVNAYIDKQVAAGIISLLKCSPNVEKLVLKSGRDLQSPYSKRVEEYWESGRMIEKFSLQRLKTVKCGFKKLADAGNFTLTLVQVLLQNAGFLECIIP